MDKQIYWYGQKKSYLSSFEHGELFDPNGRNYWVSTYEHSTGIAVIYASESPLPGELWIRYVHDNRLYNYIEKKWYDDPRDPKIKRIANKFIKDVRAGKYTTENFNVKNVPNNGY